MGPNPAFRRADLANADLTPSQRGHLPSRRQQDTVAHRVFVALVAVHGWYIGVGADHPEGVDPHFLSGLQEPDGQRDVATVTGGR